MCQLTTVFCYLFPSSIEAFSCSILTNRFTDPQILPIPYGAPVNTDASRTYTVLQATNGKLLTPWTLKTTHLARQTSDLLALSFHLAQLTPPPINCSPSHTFWSLTYFRAPPTTSANTDIPSFLRQKSREWLAHAKECDFIIYYAEKHTTQAHKLCKGVSYFAGCCGCCCCCGFCLLFFLEIACVPSRKPFLNRRCTTLR